MDVEAERNKRALLRGMKKLLAREGDLYEEIRQSWIGMGYEGDRLEVAVMGSVMHLVAVRAALYCHNLEGGENYGEMPSLILGSWAGCAIESEMEAEQIKVRKMIAEMLGLGNN